MNDLQAQINVLTAVHSQNGQGNNPLSFQVDVSRTYRNKEGYKAGGYKLNTSFVTEPHTPETFIETVIQEGWPYTMVHQKRSPQETGAAARGVLTPKHIENFVSSQLLTGDDDSQTADVIDFWLHDPFFLQYGLAFVESVNSQSGAEKGHPTLLFDCSITNPVLYKECLQAFCFAYPQLDRLTNIDRTIYNAVGARVHYLGHVCPFAIFEARILEPFRQAQREKKAVIEAEPARHKAEYEQAKANGYEASDDHKESYLRGYLHWVFDHVANKRKGDNRNMAIYWAGRCITGIEITEWARPYLHVLHDVDARIIKAAARNGYLADYAHNNEAEVLRIFKRGRAAGGEMIDKPIDRPVIRLDSGKTAINPLNYRCEDGGILDAWLDLYGENWRYVAGFEAWYEWTGSHWRKDATKKIKREIQHLLDEMNQAVRQMMRRNE